MEITEQHRSLLTELRKTLYRGRKFTIAVDGVDHSGKSTLARFLAWQLEMPAIEMDLFLRNGSDKPDYDWNVLRGIVGIRHNNNRPAILEGVFLRKTLATLGIATDFSVYVERAGHRGSETWQSQFAEYASTYKPLDNAQFIFRHANENDC